MKTMTWMIAAVALIAACSEGESESSDALASRQQQLTTEALASADLEAGRHIASWCKDCHGVGGVSRTRYIPHLAGQRPDYVIGELKAYKEGLRDNPAMHTVVNALNDTAMRNVTAYYATRGANADEPLAVSESATLESALLAVAPAVAKWVQKCNRCHDDSGYGDPGRFPILTGQREEYLAYALHAYQNKFLRTSSMMHAMTELLSREDIQNLAAYYAHRSAKERIGGPLEEQSPRDEPSGR